MMHSKNTNDLNRSQCLSIKLYIDEKKIKPSDNLLECAGGKCVYYWILIYLINLADDRNMSFWRIVQISTTEGVLSGINTFNSILIVSYSTKRILGIYNLSRLVNWIITNYNQTPICGPSYLLDLYNCQ
jgi:hypothetical protein